MSSPGVYFYKNINYDDDYGALPFTEGDYTLSQLEARGIVNDDISSVRIINNSDGSTYTFILYEHDNFLGRTYTSSSNTPNLVVVGGDFNDITSSVKIIKNSPTPTPTPTPTNVAALYDANRDASVTLTLRGSSNYTASGFFFNHIGTHPGKYIGTCAHCVLDTGGNRTGNHYFNVYASISNFNNTGINRLFKTKVVGIAGYADLAVLELVNEDGTTFDQSGLTDQKAQTWSVSTSYQIGDQCFVIGDPGGYDAVSIAPGYIRDTKNPDSLYIANVFTDCDIMGGNSGSSIIDRNGDIIGIISYGYSGTELNFGASSLIMETAMTYICNNRTSYVGGTISNNTSGSSTTMMTRLSPVDSNYLISRNKTYETSTLGFPLRGFYVRSTTYPGLNELIDVITYIPPQDSSNSQELGLYYNQITPTEIYLATNGDESSNASLSASVMDINSETTNTRNFSIRAIPVDDDVYMGHSSHPTSSNAYVIGPLKKN